MSTTSYWECTCGHVIDEHYEPDLHDTRLHNENVHNIRCPICLTKMKWNPIDYPYSLPGSPDICYDWAFQIFRKPTGETAERLLSYHIACGACGGPATSTSFDTYSERYVCMKCSYQFSVS